MAKKSKKGKGKPKAPTGPTPVTTMQIIQDRTKMLCPRMGDIYDRNEHVDLILEVRTFPTVAVVALSVHTPNVWLSQDVAERCFFKAIDKQLQEISLKALRLRRLPNLANLAQDLGALVSINLSKNNLFDGDELFQVCAYLFCLSHASPPLPLAIIDLTPSLAHLDALRRLTDEQALSCLPQLQKLNLSENFLNGLLSEHAGLLYNLEELNLDINSLTALGPAVRNWSKLKVFTISDNSLTGKVSFIGAVGLLFCIVDPFG